MNWNDVFEYRDGDIYWKIRTSNRTKVGAKFGCVCKRWGYVVGRFRGKTTRAHRVIWEMHNGQIPEGMEIDHINHIRDDNRIENLRLVSHSENMRNISRSKVNSSGITGVCWNSERGKWMAQMQVGNKHIYIGLYSDINEAVKARKQAEELYGFHENHGV